MTHPVKIAPPTALDVRRASDAVPCAVDQRCHLVADRGDQHLRGKDTLDEWFRCCSSTCVRLLAYRFSVLEARQPQQLTLGDDGGDAA